ncbi:MAG TPA: DUF885 domain-containing protein [Pyrinomonadaceae bacterium]|nr:DUF885 domain-containing protein [Pyrinomonadaceae bacterium]
MKNSMFKRWAVALCVCVALLASHATAAAPRSYTQLVDAYFNDYFAANPSQATSVGFHQYDARLEDFSLAHHQSYQRMLQNYLREFAALDARKLSQAERDDRDLVVNNIKAQLLEEQRIQMWRRNPDIYSATITGSIFSLIKRNFASTEERMRSVIAREQQMPSALQAARKVLDNPPRIYTEIAIEQLPGNIDFFQATVPDALKDVQDQELRKQFEQSNASVIAALKDYQEFLQGDLLKRSNGNFAIGAENYKLKLAYEEMVDIPLDRLLEIGYAQLHKDQQAFALTARKIDPAKKPLDVLVDVERDHPRAQELIPSAQKMLDGLRQFLVDHKIITVPGGAQATVVETPPFMRATTFASMDTPGPYEAKAGEAYYNITLPDPSWSKEKQEEYLQGYNYPLTSNVSVHEVWPGHYTQFLWLKNNPQLSKVRKLTSANTNAEGWAHYSEQMVLDEGYGNGDPRLRLAQLVDALLRDVRYIVGIRMHTQGMTMDQSKEFFVKEGYQQPVVGEMETKRGTSDPTYLYYTLGKLEILKLREDYRRKMGDKFSLQEFHDRFIRSGSPPIKIVRREMLGDNSPVL